MRFFIPFLATLVMMVSLASALQDNYYFTIPPDGEKCIFLSLPKDSLSYKEGEYSINVFSSIPASINSMQTHSSVNNRAEVPICFSAFSLNENDFGDYEISIISSDANRKVKGGICVSKIDDVDVINEEGSACDLMNSHSGLFSASLPTIKYAKAEENNTIRLNLRSSEDIEVEYNVSSGLDVVQEKGSVLLEKGKVKYVDFEFTPTRNGRFGFNVSLSVIINREYCGFPFCKKSVSSVVSVGDAAMGFQDWEFSVFPLDSNTESLEYVEYSLLVNNHGRSRIFSVDASLPSGLESDFRRIEFELNADQSRTEVVKVKPTTIDQRLYWMTFKAVSDRVESELVSLSVGESVSDICRKYPNACKDPPKIEGCRVFGSVINSSCVGDPLSQTQQTNQTDYTKPEEKPLTDSIFILLPIIVVIILIVYYFFSRKREV